MSRYISEKLRISVENRADGICEYCLISIDDTYFGGEIEHIVSLKHGGETVSENLALACRPCNRNKGSDLGSFIQNPEKLIRFYNPRTDKWTEHFRLGGPIIETLTEIGEVTAKILCFNDEERLSERKGLIEIGHFPSEQAKKLLK